jgi:hypothetical protein
MLPIYCIGDLGDAVSSDALYTWGGYFVIQSQHGLSQGVFMYNSKFHWILTAVIASSVLFYSCPPEEVEPTPPNPQAQADAALQVGILALTGAKSDGGTFASSNNRISNVKFSLSGMDDKQDLPEGTRIRLDSIKVGTVDYPLPAADKKPISIGSASTSFALPVNGLINLIGTAGVALDSFTFNIKGEYTLTSPSVYSAATYPCTITAGSVSGTLSAILNVAKHFLPSGTVINGGIGTVSTLNSGGAGTLYAGDTLGGSIVLPFVDGDGPEVVGILPAGGSVNSYKNGNTTVGPLNGGSITTGSEASVTQAGALVLIAGSTGTDTAGSIVVNGTLAIRDIGSISGAGGGSGLAQIYFGNSSTSSTTTNLLLSAGGVWYTVPQFGVLVTVYR